MDALVVTLAGCVCVGGLFAASGVVLKLALGNDVTTHDAARWTLWLACGVVVTIKILTLVS